MTREEAKRRAELYSALAEGKTIRDWTNDTWKDKEYTSFGELSQSPIKSESKYRPFETKEECWNEMLKHQPFGFVVNKDSIDYSGICRVFKDEKGISRITFTSNPYSDWDMDIAFDRINFADGTPFGIKEE